MTGSQALDYELGWRRLLDPGRTASKAVVAQVRCSVCVRIAWAFLALGYGATAAARIFWPLPRECTECLTDDKVYVCKRTRAVHHMA